MACLTGLDVLREDSFSDLRGNRIGVLANAASVDSNLTHIVDLLHGAPGVTLVKIFAPEHGFRGAPQDMIAVHSSTDPKTELPIVSLYGNTSESLSPKKDDLQGLDLLVIDLPDIGTRYYTYAQTMALAMQVAGEAGVKVIVLDRPNPLGGVEIEGGTVTKRCRSFCGMTPVPQRHGLTLGELAVLYEGGFGVGEDAYPAARCNLRIIKVRGWKRSEYLDQTGLPWVIPSPNMPTLDTAMVYPGGCLFEATNLSEGRGTTRPFEFVGAPFIDGEKWEEAALRESFVLEGAILRPIQFQPQFHKWKGELCGGVQIHVTDRAVFRPLRWGLALIAAARRLYSKEFAWRTEPYEFIDNVPAIDLLYGGDLYRKAVEAGDTLVAVEAELAQFEQWFRTAREPYLLYK